MVIFKVSIQIWDTLLTLTLLTLSIMLISFVALQIHALTIGTPSRHYGSTIGGPQQHFARLQKVQWSAPVVLLKSQGDAIN